MVAVQGNTGLLKGHADPAAIIDDGQITAIADTDWTRELQVNIYRAQDNARPVVGKLWRHLVQDTEHRHA